MLIGSDRGLLEGIEFFFKGLSGEGLPPFFLDELALGFLERLDPLKSPAQGHPGRIEVVDGLDEIGVEPRLLSGVVLFH